LVFLLTYPSTTPGQIVPIFNSGRSHRYPGIGPA
jgi:hypothetical protein